MKEPEYETVCVPSLMKSCSLTWWTAVAVFTSAPAQATRPMVVDDANITGPKTCQVESWIQHTLGQVEYWAVPACNVAGSWELAAGLARVVPKVGGSYGSGVIQAKTMFRPLEKNGWGIGVTIANLFRDGNDGLGDVSVLLPVSISTMDDRLLLHANIGWTRGRKSGLNDGLWAIGGEWATHSLVTLTLEAYRTQPSQSFAQVGMRVAVIPDRLTIDAGIGSRIARFGADRYYTVGMTFAGRRP